MTREKAAQPGGERVLPASPTGVLYIVSEPDPRAVPVDWVPLIAEGSFRQYMVGVAITQATFAAIDAGFPGESWHLDDFIPETAIAEFIMEFIASREIDLVQIMNSRLGLDLLPALRFSYPELRVAIDFGTSGSQSLTLLTYATSRYGNLIDLFFASDETVVGQLDAAFISPSKVQLTADAPGGGGAKAVARVHQDAYGRLLAPLDA